MAHAGRALSIRLLGFALIAALRLSAAWAAPPSPTQQAWLAMASAQTSSPAVASLGDKTMGWFGPNGSYITLTIRVPHPAGAGATVAVANVPAGTDSTPVFKSAVAAARASNASILNIKKGTYTFYSLDPTGLGHLVLQGLSDMTIEGNGSTFVFMNNATGIYLTTSQRLQIQDISIHYGLHMASLGTIQSIGGENELIINSAYPVTAADGIGHIAEYNTTTNLFVPGGQRVYLPSNLKYVGNQTYTSSSFSSDSLVGRTYVVFHHYYGGVAFLMEDSPGPSQTQDIALDRVTINSGPGMGVVVYGVKRGVMIANSQVVPLPGALISTEYDGIHIILAGGDVGIINNVISSQGDDGITLNNPVIPVVSVAANATSVVLSTYSRFIQISDTLAFFDANDNFLGTTTVTSAKGLGGLNFQIGLSGTISGLSIQTVARDIALIDSRVAVLQNTIENCQCHGMLVQVPNTIVEGNIIQNTAGGGIELLTNVGSFKEGVGAINVIVAANTLANTGFDDSLPMNWSAISMYGAINGAITTTPVNQQVQIKGNVVTNALNEGCISVASADTISVTGNSCNGSNVGQAVNTPSIWLSNTNAVTLTKNQRTGQTTGPIGIDATDTNVVSQPNY